jgi:hypothetical protein
MIDERCADCRYLDTRSASRDLGQCRRNAPRSHLVAADVDNDDLRVRGVWPLVAFHDWCGQFERKRKAAKVTK